MTRSNAFVLRWTALQLATFAGVMALLLALGAFAEGTFGLPLTAACCLAGYHSMRAAWAAEQRAESRAAMRRARRTAAAGSRRPDASKARRPESLRAA